jgi:DNA polymerase/3'-5' exonuclease PolX
MELRQAKQISQEIVDILKPHCREIMVVGSIRREKPICHDIDIVLVPANQGALAMALNDLGQKIKSGPKIHACKYKFEQVEIYIADERTWPTLVLIRTGSKEHNIKLCARAKSLGMKLHADGSGIEYVSSSGEPDRLLPKDEADVFKMMGLPYVEPRRRN